ncbi:hypothetical protein NG821_11100 [Prevotella cerevisiae]|uniref:Tetratricopeptide repeat protein n=1 Tax=Segatella cerevisiae TaxID=2053716 RepID=A0ABT1BZ71_9BACT|nr:tetratricopeptide repeat protein [Segatella cerevisiae]MCO6026377.1 hypothetical protein [Segatella cerevisiae]
MKKIVILFILLSTFSSRIYSQSNGNFHLDQIQSTLDRLYANSIQSKNQDSLVMAGKWLATQKQSKVVTYWQSYEKLFEGLSDLNSGMETPAKNAIGEAIKIIESYKHPDSELYALLAYAQSVSIRFATGMDAATLAMESTKNAQKAIAADSMNIRGWVILGMIDYYSPEIYGGKTKCESLWTKALSLPSQESPNRYLPSWGKREAYVYLLRYLTEKKQSDKAKTIYSEAVKAYPNDPEISRFKDSFTD